MEIISVKQRSSWENIHSAGKQILPLSWNLNVHYRLHKIPSLVPILSQMHPLHIFPSCFLKFNSCIIVSSTPRSPKWSLALVCSDQNSVSVSQLFYACCMPLPSHRPSFDDPSTLRREAQRILSIQFMHPPVTYSLIKVKVKGKVVPVL